MLYKAIIIDNNQLNCIYLRKIITNYFQNIEVVNQFNSDTDAKLPIDKLSSYLFFIDISFAKKELFESIILSFSNVQFIFMSDKKEDYHFDLKKDSYSIIKKTNTEDWLMIAIDRALNRLQKNDYNSRYRIHNEENKSFIVISTLDSYEIIKTKDIMYCNADGRYTIFYLKDGKKLIASKNLNEYCTLLKNSPLFIRVSRSHIVNFEYVIRINKKEGMYCEFSNGSNIPISRRKHSDLQNFLLSLE